MGRIKKAAGPKHEATVSPAVATFVNIAVTLPIAKLPSHINSFPRRWPFPKGDVYHWIPLLNRFDAILEHFSSEYGLQAGPQTRKFTRALLEKGVAEETSAATVTGTSQEELDQLGYGKDGDRTLVESLLDFSRVLLENCGNRSLYNSSDRLGELLNTTDLSLLTSALRLAVRLAQRYHASRQRGANASQHLNTALLASHYNIDLEKVQKLANPFTKLSSASAANSVLRPTTPTVKGKEKAHSQQSKPVHSSDLSAIARGDFPHANGDADRYDTPESSGLVPSNWEEWGSVAVTFYQPPIAPKEEAKPSTPVMPSQTTPSQPRRPSGLSRQSRISSFEDSSENPTSIGAAKPVDTTSVGGMKTVEIYLSKIDTTAPEDILNETTPGLPKEAQSELLTKLRIAHGMIKSSTTRQQIVGIRLLAITNLAYIYPDTILQQKILQQDSDEPRRLQLAYQLADLIHASGKNQRRVPIWLQTLAIGTLEALAKHKGKASDIGAALNVNVTHGVLLYILRRAVTDMANDDSHDDEHEGDDWREALFSLLETLPTSAPRTGEALIAAGLLEVIVEVLNLRTGKAQRSQPKILAFLDSIIYSVRDAFQTFANLKGLDAISDLIASEVQSGLENTSSGNGLSPGFRNHSIDYQIPYYQQQTIRWLFKFVNHMMSHGSGNFDRLLRNLIDSPQLLGGLRTVMFNGKTFGSSAWSGAVNIMSNFIHNEPTSYAVIAEAGLSKGLLEAITSRTFPEPKRAKPEALSTEAAADQQSQTEGDDSEFWNRDINELLKPTNLENMLARTEKRELAANILPATDAIVTIPQAFGAICLNNAGMDLFIRSNALNTFFEIFESPDHVKALAREGDFSRLLGGSFDELVRHHPRLKELVMRSSLNMVKRVSHVCDQTSHRTNGAKLWTEGKTFERHGVRQDIVMGNSDSSPVKTPGITEIRNEDNSKTDPDAATYIDVAMKFLTGFFENTTLCSAFVERGGACHVLDLATSESLKWDFNMQTASHEIAKVIHMLAEQKAHLVLPTLLRRTQNHIDKLEPIISHADEAAYFSRFTTPEQDVKEVDAELGTELVKSLVAVHTFCNILFETFSGPIYNSRSSHTVFSQVNLADMYIDIVKGLSRLHRCCVWEEILLQKTISPEWNEASRVEGYGMGSEEADEVLGFLTPDDSNASNGFAIASGSAGASPESRRASSSLSSKKSKKDMKAQLEKTAQFKNLITLRYLLSQVPSSIIPFFQGLGKSLVAKRRPDAYSRQNAYFVADAIAESTLEQLKFEAPKRLDESIKNCYAYWIVILTSISQLIIEGPHDRPHAQCLTLLLQAFQGKGGLKSIKDILVAFCDEVETFQHHEGEDDVDKAARLASAYGGIKIILNFYGQIVNTKAIVESAQTLAITSSDRDRGHPHFFSASQFLVELRMAVLPPIRSMWDSSFVEKASDPTVKRLIEILRTILEDGEEQGAFRDVDKVPQRASSPPIKKYSIHNDKINILTEKGYTKELAREALYRCLNVISAAEEYCQTQKDSELPANPIPVYEREIQHSPLPSPTPRRTSEAGVPGLGTSALLESGATPSLPSVEALRSLIAPHLEGAEARGEESASLQSSVLSSAVNASAESQEGPEDGMSFSIDNLLNPADIVPRDGSQSRRSSPGPSTPQNATEAEKLPEIVTWDQLDSERRSLRGNIIERALDVLNVHDSVTFELADLINTASSKTPGASSMRKDIGETLVQSLISFQAEEDFRPAGKKIAAYANLLALVIQDRDFYDSTFEELQSQFSALMGFIRIFPDSSAEEPSPWIGQILLVLEKLLAEDAQPSQIQWSPPPSEGGSRPSTPPLTMEKPRLPMDVKSQLFGSIVEILPRIGKDESLALSVVRVLVILTRHREIASRLGEKPNIQRLFVMVKQLAGITNDRLQNSFMLLLRHIVEDDDILRQIMRSEILANFESRPARTIDTSGYVRQMYHLVLRSPEIFVEVTNEILEIKTYDSSQRPQNLVMKPEAREVDGNQDQPSAAEASKTKNLETSTTEASKPTTEGAIPQLLPKVKASEAKAPTVDRPSGVVHYILCELLAYKEVVDKDQVSAAKQTTQGSPEPEDVDMEDSVYPTMAPLPPEPSSESTKAKKTEKPDFKPEQHPIYIYRCFLLQCLTELLRSYNRTKIEFANFSRRADGKATTPSKPRSNVLNYLLNDVIPVGTLNHEESISFRKRLSTSNWAMSTIVSLCLKTNEFGYEKKRGSLEEEQDTDLQFVRKFVLEHALKSYKDANASEDSLDSKYARLLCLADLFNRLLTGKIVQSVPGQLHELNAGPQKVLARVMYEKNFISALTASIADIDLNFPGSKRAVKYILRPLKQLTQTAIVVSETSDDSTTTGQTDDDEISSATSVSEVNGEREETPDLFRNSTLGMFEPGREEESSSESSDEDEDMYDEEEYDEEGMEFEDEMERDGDEVVSDEDEDIAGVGHLEGLPGDASMNVEVVIDGEEDGMSEAEDDEEDEDEDEDDSDDMEGDGEDIEAMEEITGDDENDSLVEVEGLRGEEWQDEGDEDEPVGEEDGEIDLGDGRDAESAVRNIAREFADGPSALPDLALEMEGDFAEGGGPDDDDDEDAEEDEEEDAEDDDVIYQPEFGDEDTDMPDPPWGFDPDDEQPMAIPRHHHHHHHHPRRISTPWQILPNIAGGPGDRLPLYRSHRPSAGPRPADDGVNPLLQRRDASSSSNRSGPPGVSDAAASISDYWVHGMEPPPPRGIGMEGPVSFISNIIAAVGQGGSGFASLGNGALHLHVGGGRGGALPREVQALLGLRQSQEPARASRDDPMQSTQFIPASTPNRWQEEARLLYGNAHAEKVQRVVNSLLRLMVPPAIEKEAQRKEAHKKAMQDAERLAKEKAEQERKAKEEAEKEAREKREQEEREAADAAESDAASRAGTNDDGEQVEGRRQEVMEGIETAETERPAGSTHDTESASTTGATADTGPSEPTERIRTTIRGQELDITGMGIDLEYLDALPEELREEVLMSQLALQRSEAAAAGQEPTDISREFLEALPPDIREELLQQEAQDRRRREREEARRGAAAEGGGPRAEEMDPASFLASLDPHLRQAVLMEQDDEVLAQLPTAIAAEARALGGERIMHRFGDLQRLNNRARGNDREERTSQAAAQKPQRRPIRQMLDKSGVPTLLRLMFIQQQGSSRQTLNGILHDISQNKQNRAEVISLLLSILQDGTIDVNAVERSFTSLSLRAKQPAAPKTPQTPKRTLTNQISPLNNSEMTPLMVVQQCLAALVSLTQYNVSIPFFFLTEHEVASSVKGKSARKGKAKETKASRYALNALLTLLDRKLIMESSGCMEQLSSLLQSVTHPLTMLLRKQKDKPEELEKPEAAPSTATLLDPNTQIENITDLTHDALPEGESNVSATPMPSVRPENTAPDAAGQNPPTTVGAADAETKPIETSNSSEEKVKKPKSLSPPVVPEENLRLVVNILAARECSGKTFRDTLSTINNLSAIPEAKEVFGRALIEQAKLLGQSILDDLDDLITQISKAETGTDIQGLALTKFSPASSDQAKLLRVLTALDYLFDPKRNNGKIEPATEEKAENGESSTSKEDLLTTLYEHPTFGSLWAKLSECLSTIRQADGTLSVATILLPLIEALMVVCKNTTIKDAPLIKAAKEFSITSPPPESRIETLFFRFTEDHRKILNDLVRHNPKLMSGTFSLLVKNPKVLEFDNKRNYFTRRLHSRSAEQRHPQPPLQLSVRRDQVFLDSFKFLSFKSGDEIKYGKLSIRFNGEEGVDAGGVTREWFQVLSRQMFNPDYALFIPVASDRTTFHPNKLSHVNEEHLMFFQFIGRIIGKALYEGRALDCHFSRAVYKRILGKSVSIKDMETLDLDYYKSLLWMLENDITEIITETFSIETDDFGKKEVVDLITNGRNIPVTEENKHEYVQRVVEYRLTGSVQTQLEQFLKGFHDIVPPELIAIFNEQELELLISGLPDIDVDDWKNHTEYHNYSASSSQIQWFWRAVRSFDKEERAKLLQFVTGTSKVPLNGFGQLEGMNGFSRFNIHRDYGNKDRLPSSHTCFNQLDLPEYDTYESLRQQLYTAMTAGSEYFGFA